MGVLEGGEANFFLSRQADGVVEEYSFPGTDKGIMVLGMDGPPYRIDRHIEIRSMFLYAKAAFCGLLDTRWLPIELSLIPIQLTPFLISEQMEDREEQDLAGLVNAPDFPGKSRYSYRSEVTLVCVAELHAAYKGLPNSEFVDGVAASLAVDESFRREIVELSTSRLSESCGFVLSESGFRSAAEKDSLLPTWEADMKDLIQRLS